MPGRKELAAIIAAAMAILTLFGLTPPATAGPCGVRERILRDLAVIYKERRTAAGLTHSGELLEVYVSAAGTWTIVVSSRSGRSCVIAAGEAWHRFSLDLEASTKPMSRGESSSIASR
jgi:hypothetical protein